MKDFLKSFLSLIIVFGEIVGFLCILMQYKIISQDIIILASGILAGTLFVFGIATFTRTLIHNTDENKKPACAHRIKPSVIIFWALLICSLIMMIITNVLACVGFNYKSAIVICFGTIWAIFITIPCVMYLFDMVIIDDEERRREEHLNEIREQFFKENAAEIEEDNL